MIAIQQYYIISYYYSTAVRELFKQGALEHCGFRVETKLSFSTRVCRFSVARQYRLRTRGLRTVM